MHLVYVDDSGDAKHGTMLSALIVAERNWSPLLEAWLSGRRAINDAFGVRKHAELHANQLFKGRGKFCETPEQEWVFGAPQRAAVGRIMLSHLARSERCRIVTLGSPNTTRHEVYAQFVAWLEDWASANDTYMIVFYDGQQGLHYGPAEPTAEELADLWHTAIRNATPYRRVHRDLDLAGRRIIEDVIMQDSQYSQLIQAADLIAYGGYQLHKQNHPEIWGTASKPVPDAIRAYIRTRRLWMDGSDNGVFWLDHPPLTHQ